MIPCSSAHKSCSPWHSDLVWEYRRERERQETALESILNHAGDKEHWKATGGTLITFGQWLRSKRQERQ